MVLELASIDPSTMTMLRSTHSLAKEKCWSREIAVPWKDSFIAVSLELWSILSTASVPNTLPRKPFALCGTVGRHWSSYQLRIGERCHRRWSCSVVTAYLLIPSCMQHHPLCTWKLTSHMRSALPDSDWWCGVTYPLVVDDIELENVSDAKCCMDFICHLVLDARTL